MLAALRDRISAAQEEVGALEEKASRAEDPVKAREAALEFTSAVARHVLALMDGDARPDPGQHGLTSEEEVGAIGREVKGRGFDGWPRETWEAEETCAGLR